MSNFIPSHCFGKPCFYILYCLGPQIDTEVKKLILSLDLTQSHLFGIFQDVRFLTILLNMHPTGIENSKTPMFSGTNLTSIEQF